MDKENFESRNINANRRWYEHDLQKTQPVGRKILIIRLRGRMKTEESCRDIGEDVTRWVQTTIYTFAFSKYVWNCFSWWDKANPRINGSHVSNMPGGYQILAAQAVPCKVRRRTSDVFAALKGRWGRGILS